MHISNTLRGLFLGLSLGLLSLSSAHADMLININTADAETLTTLTGVGAAKAAAIIEYRDMNGGFTSVDDLSMVNGIGAATVDNNRDRITLE